MAEIAVMAMTALGAGGTAAAGTAVAAGSTLLTALQGIATVVSIFGAVGQANAQAEQSEAMAIQTDLDRGQALVEGAHRSTQMKRELFRILGENDVAFAAAGIDVSGGIAQGSRSEATRRATQEISIERADDDYRRAMLKVRSDGLRRRASQERGAGMINAIGQIAGFGMDMARRG